MRRHFNHHFEKFVSGFSLELCSSFLSDLDSILDLTFGFDAEFLGSIGHGDQSPEFDLTIDDASLSCNRRLAVSVQGFQETTFAVDTDMGIHVVQFIDVFEGTFVVRSTLDTNGSLCNSGEHFVPVENGCGVFVHIHSLQSSNSQKRGIYNTIVQFSETGLDVSSEVDTFQGWVLCKDLRLSAQRSSSDDRSIRKLCDRFVFVVFCDEGIIGVFPGEIARKYGSFWQPCRDVLHGVNANVDFIAQESNIEFLGEKSLSSQFH